MDGLADAIHEAGLPLGAITTEPVALATYCNFFSAEDESVQAVFSSARGRDYATLCTDGHPISSHRVSLDDAVAADIAVRQVEEALPERGGDALLIVGQAAEGEGQRSFAEMARRVVFEKGMPPALGDAEAVAVGAALSPVG